MTLRFPTRDPVVQIAYRLYPPVPGSTAKETESHAASPDVRPVAVFPLSNAVIRDVVETEASTIAKVLPVTGALPKSTSISLVTIPFGPVGPVAPVLPIDPLGPVGPVLPVLPVAPSGPVGPDAPVAPVAPSGPVGPI